MIKIVLLPSPSVMYTVIPLVGTAVAVQQNLYSLALKEYLKDIGSDV